MPEHIYITNYLNEKPKGLAVALLVEETELQFETPDGKNVTCHDRWYRYATLAELMHQPAQPLAA